MNAGPGTSSAPRRASGRQPCAAMLSASEIADSIAAHGCRPLARLGALDVPGPAFMAIHAVHCDEGDIAELARHASHVVHCPSSNLKLGSGVAPIAAMRSAG